MTIPSWDRIRRWLARRGISPQRRIYSPSLWGLRKSDVRQSEAPGYGLSRGSDAWPIHVVLRELDSGRGFGFAHFNNGECHCLIQGTHTNRDGVEICPQEVRHLLEGCIERLTSSSDPRVRERFLVGLPCPRCHGVRAEDVLRKFPGLRHYPRVPATLFHHAIQWSRPLLAAGLVKRGGDAFLVCSTEHDVDAIERLLGISFRAVLRVDRFRAHENPGVFDEWAHEIGWGTRATNSDSASPTMLFLCGIMGRCWAVQAFVSEPDSLTLCLGSYFDDVSLGRVLKYTEGRSVGCKRCLRVR